MSENRALGGLEDSPKDTIKHGKNHLFAIGINTYQKFTPLLNAVKDVEDIAKVLSEDYSFDSILLLSDQDATKDNIIDKLDGLRRSVAPEDKLLIYYSGHGFTDNDRGFWIPVDAEPDRVSSYIANAEVHDIIQFIKARHILLISDSCFSGSLLVRDVASDMGGAFDDWDRNPSRYAFISGGGVVSDGKPGENSPFAGGIIKQLRDNEENAINICRLADQVTQEIRYNYRQQAEVSPIFEVGHKGGQFVFVKKQTEKEVWAAALANHDEGSYLDYLGRYPKGKFLNEAEQKLKDIADENEWSKAAQKDAAISYRQYLKIYPDGKHVSEANSKLEAIKQEDLRDKEAARKLEQERLFILEKLKRESIPSPTPNTKSENKEPRKPNNSPNGAAANEPKQKSKAPKYIFFVVLAGVLVAIGIFWPKNEVYIHDSPITQLIDTIDLTFEIEGNVVDETNKNKIAGIMLTNSRNKISDTSDESGHFTIANTLNGDTISITESDKYVARAFVVRDNIRTGDVDLAEKPRIKVNKTITGTVKNRNGNLIKGAWIYVKRNGKIIQPYTHTLSNGKYTLTKVNEGDILWIDAGSSYKKKNFTVGADNEYNWVVN